MVIGSNFAGIIERESCTFGTIGAMNSEMRGIHLNSSIPNPAHIIFNQHVLKSFYTTIPFYTVCILLTFWRFILATLVALPFTPMSWSVTRSFELE